MNETEIDEADLALLDYCMELKEHGVSMTQAIEMAVERIHEIYRDLSESDETLH
jgi:hypothetical protein